MSLKKPQLFIYLFLFVAFGFYKFNSPKPVTRKSFGAVNISQYSSRGLVDRIINLKINVINEQDIVAEISLPFDYDGALEYKWILGQNVILKKGTLTGLTPQGFQKEISQKIKISVDGFNSQANRHIGFEVWGVKNNRRIFAEGLIASQSEKSFENIVQNVERIKAEKTGIKK